MNIKEISLSSKCFISQATEKKYIVIHGSNSRSQYSPLAGKKGSADDVIDRWNKNKEKFGCPYLIERDGAIVKTFDDKYWSYHLNINNSHGVYDKMSIGIELINEGNLIKDNGHYYINGYVQHQNNYTGPVNEIKFRNYNYYAKISLPQLESLISLIKELSVKHSILPIYYTSNDFNKKVWDKATVFTHSVVNAKVTDLPFNTEITERLNKEFSHSK